MLAFVAAAGAEFGCWWDGGAAAGATVGVGDYRLPAIGAKCTASRYFGMTMWAFGGSPGEGIATVDASACVFGIVGAAFRAWIVFIAAVRAVTH